MESKTHRPCLIVASVFALGIILGQWIVLPAWIWVGILCIFVCFYFWCKNLIVLYLLISLLGSTWITQRNLLPQNSLAFLPYQHAINCQAIEGVVISPEDYFIQVQQILINDNWQEVSGRVKLRAWGRGDLKWTYGDHVRIYGKMYPIHDFRSGSFSYRRYLKERGVFWMFSPKKSGLEVIGVNQGNMFIASAYDTRGRMNDIFDQYLAPRESAFVSALVIGARHNMPKDLKEVFVNTGTAHILAISGMNMAVLVTVFFFFFQITFIPRRWKFIMTAIFLFAYAYISGWSPSVVRATIMSAVLLSSFAFEQEGEALNSLGLAAFILMTLDPRNLFDIGFQLSFAAVVGILTLTRPIEGLLTCLPKFLAISIAVSTAAFVTTSGIIAYHFHMVTPVSVLANIPIVPLADMVMALGLALVFVSFCPMVATLFAACLKAILSAMILCAVWFSKIPWGSWHF